MLKHILDSIYLPYVRRKSTKSSKTIFTTDRRQTKFINEVDQKLDDFEPQVALELAEALVQLQKFRLKSAELKTREIVCDETANSGSVLPIKLIFFY